MNADIPLHRFQEFGSLSAAEREAVRSFGSAPRRYHRGATIRAEGDIAEGLYLLIEGWAAAAVTLADGRRQIAKVHLPGDLLGTPSMCVARTSETLSAITAVVVSAVSFERFGRLLQEFPRVAAYQLLSVQRERLSLMDQLALMGRTSAEARLAAMLVDLLERLRPLGDADDGGYLLPLTQEQIGDVLGLTGVHVNRMMRELEDRELIARDRQQLKILDLAGLVRLAGRPERTLRVDAPWLPPHA